MELIQQIKISVLYFKFCRAKFRDFGAYFEMKFAVIWRQFCRSKLVSFSFHLQSKIANLWRSFCRTKIWFFGINFANQYCCPFVSILHRKFTNLQHLFRAFVSILKSKITLLESIKIIDIWLLICKANLRAYNRLNFTTLQNGQKPREIGST